MIHGMVCCIMNRCLCKALLYVQGTKNVAKTLTKVVKGRQGNPVKDQLSDKRKKSGFYSLFEKMGPCRRKHKRHLYWCMKNCNGCPEELKASTWNISKHYQVFLPLLWS